MKTYSYGDMLAILGEEVMKSHTLELSAHIQTAICDAESGVGEREALAGRSFWTQRLPIFPDQHILPLGGQKLVYYLPPTVLCLRALTPLESLCHIDNSTLSENGLLGRNVTYEMNISLIL